MQPDTLIMNGLNTIRVPDYQLPDGNCRNFDLTYQSFGLPLGKAPVVLINHPLTGNSQVIGKEGWWAPVVGEGKTIDLNRFTVLAFNVPGNGHAEGEPENYSYLTARIVADLYWKAVNKLGIHQLFAVTGGSLGGSLAWEMAFLRPQAIDHVIPIACCLRSSDWLIANALVQEQILESSSNPIEHARMHAMLLYRTPASFETKFNRKKSQEGYAVESWLNYHGSALEKRYKLQAYKNMNHLLKTAGETLTEADIKQFAQTTAGHIHCIVVDQDYLFTRKEQYDTYCAVKRHNGNIDFQEINSVHGHDAFLIEFEQLHNILNPIFHESYKSRREVPR